MTEWFVVGTCRYLQVTILIVVTVNVWSLSWLILVLPDCLHWFSWNLMWMIRMIMSYLRYSWSGWAWKPRIFPVHLIRSFWLSRATGCTNQDILHTGACRIGSLSHAKFPANLWTGVGVRASKIYKFDYICSFWSHRSDVMHWTRCIVVGNSAVWCADFPPIDEAV